MEKTFQYVDYLWDEAKAAELGDDQVALFLYRSNILGADLSKKIHLLTKM